MKMRLMLCSLASIVAMTACGPADDPYQDCIDKCVGDEPGPNPGNVIGLCAYNCACTLDDVCGG